MAVLETRIGLLAKVVASGDEKDSCMLAEFAALIGAK
jgi:hypothetical protein